jgi:DNA-directed RNA polymerase specialized sigma24 family protein
MDAAAIVRGVVAGEAGSEEQLYHLMRKSLHCRAIQKIGPNNAEDHLHTIYVIVLEHIREGRIRNPEAISAYYSRIAKRKYKDEWRRNGREVQIVEGFEDGYSQQRVEASEEPAADKVIEIQETRAHCLDLLSGLPDKYRIVLERFYVGGESREKIKAEMDWTENQFRLNKSRGIAELRRRFGGPGWRAAYRKKDVILFDREAGRTVIEIAADNDLQAEYVDWISRVHRIGKRKIAA